MRRSMLALFVAASAACSFPGETENKAKTEAEDDAMAVVAVSAAPGGECAMRLDGRPVTRDALVEALATRLQAAIAALGGIQAVNFDNLPEVRIEAASAMPYACISRALGNIEDTGAASIVLRVADDNKNGDVPADLFLSTASTYPPTSVIELGPDDSIQWNRRAADRETYRAWLREVGGEQAPNDFVLVPLATTRFGMIHELILDARRAGVRTTLSSCRRSGDVPEGSLEPLGEQTPLCDGVTA